MRDQEKCVRCGSPNVVKDHLCHQCGECETCEGGGTVFVSPVSIATVDCPDCGEDE